MSNGAFDHERFKNISAGFQSIVTAVAVGIAGLWVVFSFVTLKSAQKAAAEVASLELAVKQEPVLQIALTTSSPATGASGPRRILFHAQLKNDGKRVLEFTPPSLHIVQVDTGSGVTEPLIKVTAEIIDSGGKRVQMPSRVLRSGQSRTIAYSALLPSSGDYLVQLESEYHGMDNIEGMLVLSDDVPIQANEQQIFSVR